MKLNHCVVMALSKDVQQVSDRSGNKSSEMSSVNWVNNNSSSNSSKTSWKLRMRDEISNWKSLC